MLLKLVYLHELDHQMILRGLYHVHYKVRIIGLEIVTVVVEFCCTCYHAMILHPLTPTLQLYHISGTHQGKEVLKFVEPELQPGETEPLDHMFSFDRIFGPSVSQDDVYAAIVRASQACYLMPAICRTLDEMPGMCFTSLSCACLMPQARPLVLDVLQGVNATLFAYGQTGKCAAWTAAMYCTCPCVHSCAYV